MVELRESVLEVQAHLAIAMALVCGSLHEAAVASVNMPGWGGRLLVGKSSWYPLAGVFGCLRNINVLVREELGWYQ